MSGQASTSSLAEPEVIDLTGLDEEDSDQNDDEDSEHSSDDSDDSVEVQLNKDTRSRLYIALAGVPETQIRSILNQLIEQVPAVEYALTRELVTLKRKPDDHDYERHIERCINCHEEFDTQTKRRSTECSFHPGSLEPDWDEDVHGPINAERTRREYPENFSWSCCDADGESEGCVHGAHQPGNPQKKARVAA